MAKSRFILMRRVSSKRTSAGMLTPRKVSVLKQKCPGHRYHTTTLIAARLAGCFTAPLLFEGSCDTLAFNTYLSEMLCPLLDETHVVIMDNASFHKGSQTAETLIPGVGGEFIVFTALFSGVEPD